MEIKLQCGDKIKIPTGCKATVSDGYVLVEAAKPRFKRGDFLASKGGRNILIFEQFNNERPDFSSFFNNSEGTNSDWAMGAFDYASEEQKNQLIEYMHSVGKDWDIEKQEVVDWEWRPKIGDNYFIIDPEDGSGVMELSYENDSIDNINFKIGIAFKTRELAEEALFMLKQCKHY